VWKWFACAYVVEDVDVVSGGDEGEFGGGFLRVAVGG